MRDVEFYDVRFVQNVLYLFDQGKNIREIAFLMDTDVEIVDNIICDSLAKDMVEDAMKDFEPKC